MFRNVILSFAIVSGLSLAADDSLLIRTQESALASALNSRDEAGTRAGIRSFPPVRS
jgi:hypothetical protein